MKRILTASIFLASISFSLAHEKALAPGDLRSVVHYLASEELEGRMTGSDGSRKAADFLAAELQKAGLQPAGDNGTWFQKFEFSAGVKVPGTGNKLELAGKESGVKSFKVNEDYRPLAFTGNGTAEGEVVFAGYGLRVPDKGGKAYDSYAGLDVKDKIVLVFRYVPEDVTPERRAELNRYAGLRYKAMIARENGAKALLVITGPNSPGAGELVPISSDAGVAGSGIVAASISHGTAATLLAGSGKDLKVLQSGLDNENPHAESGFSLQGVRLKLTAAVERIRKTDRNVIAILPPSNGATEYVLVGAHYDHLGHGETGAMKRKGEEHAVHYGADDNASGTAVVLALAELQAKARQANPGKPLRGIIFGFWSGEELGLIGSTHHAEHPAIPLKDIVAYVNFDMVGRLRENKLSLQGIGSSSDWKKLLEKQNVAAGFSLALQEDPYLPTDSTAFYPKNVPVLNFFTGAHEDYHRPTDTAETLNYEGLERITRFANGLLTDIAASEVRPVWAKVERASGPGGGSRDNLRVYIGTIPDYASEVSGVKLSGVRAGAPADKAGLQGGDIIIEFAGQKIANIYDFTYALDAAKIGKEAKVVVLRSGKTESFTVTPEARK